MSSSDSTCTPAGAQRARWRHHAPHAVGSQPGARPSPPSPPPRLIDHLVVVEGWTYDAMERGLVDTVTALLLRGEGHHTESSRAIVSTFVAELGLTLWFLIKVAARHRGPAQPVCRRPRHARKAPSQRGRLSGIRALIDPASPVPDCARSTGGVTRILLRTMNGGLPLGRPSSAPARGRRPKVGRG